MNYLKKIDFLGTSPCFLYEGSKQYTSVKGSLASLLTFLCSVVCIYFFGMKLVGSELDSATFSKIYEHSPSPLSFKDNNFAFYFGLQDRTFSHVYRNDLLDVKFLLRTDKPSALLVTEELPHKSCELEDFGNSSDSFKAQSYKGAYCLDRKQMDAITLNSTFGYENFQYLTISVFTCKNTTESNNCAPQEEIDEYANGFYFDFGFVKDIIDSNNFENPGKREFEDHFWSASQNYKKTVIFYLSKILVNSDVGWVFEENRKDSYFEMGKIKENLELREADEFLRLSIRLHNESSVWTRKYYKLQHFVAEIGGVIKGLVLFAKILVLPFSRTEMVLSIMNDVIEDDLSKNRLDNLDINANNSISKLKSDKHMKVEISFLEALLHYIPGVGRPNKMKIRSLVASYEAAMDVKKFVRDASTLQNNLQEVPIKPREVDVRPFQS